MPKKGRSGRKAGVGKIVGPEDWDRAHHGDAFADLPERDKNLVLTLGAIFRGTEVDSMVGALEWKATPEEKRAEMAEFAGTDDPETINRLLAGEAEMRGGSLLALRELFGEIAGIAKGQSSERLVRWMRGLEASERQNELLVWLNAASVSPPTAGRPRHISCTQSEFTAWVRKMSPKLLQTGDRSTVSKTASRHGFTFEGRS